jgi:D-aminopeptidase
MTNAPPLKGTVTPAFDEGDIDQLLAPRFTADRPGAAVGIAIDGAPVYRKGFGLANAELPVSLGPSMRMRIFSITKHFTCLAYLLLCEEGRVHIDDPISKFVPEVHPAIRRVTVRQLMSHTSGIRDALDIHWQFSGTGQPIACEDIASSYRDIDDVNFAPGTSFTYCNGGYLLLSIAMERICQQRLEDILAQRIFIPAGLHDTMLRRYDLDFLPNSAALHMTQASGGYERSYLGADLTGAGGIVSTVDDMLRWLSCIDASLVGSAFTWAAMTRAERLANGHSTGYALGLVRAEHRGLDTIQHSGSGMGGNAQMLKIPAARLDVVVLVNRHDLSGDEILQSILDVCLPARERFPVRNSFAVQYSQDGVFKSPRSGRVIELRAAATDALPWIRKGQQLLTIDGTDIPMEMSADCIFKPTGIFAFSKLELRCERAGGRRTGMELSDYGNVDRYEPTEPSVRAESDEIIGRYHSEGVGVDATVTSTAQGPLLLTSTRFGTARFQLEPVASHIWRAVSLGPMKWDGMLVFEREHQEFRFSTLRTRGLRFCRLDDSARRLA